MHSKEKIWIPEMIFGHLLTSSNYDDEEKKVTGGRNGYGAKLTNIYSTEFSLETSHFETKKKFQMTWKDNMLNASKPSITPFLGAASKQYTKITFKPDLPRFHMTELDADIVALMKKRVYDIAGCNPTLKVYLNGELIKINNFSQYVKLYFKEEGTKFVHERFGPRWEICIAASTSGTFEQVSFVNSIWTTQGGTHVNHVVDKIVKTIQELVKKKKKDATVTPSQVKNHMWIFVNSLIENPAFTSQTKDVLTTKSSNFGSACKITPEYLKKGLFSSLFI